MSLRNERKRDGKVGRTSLFKGFVLNETHCVLVFNHSLDELSFSQSLCIGGKKTKTKKHE